MLHLLRLCQLYGGYPSTLQQSLPSVDERGPGQSFQWETDGRTRVHHRPSTSLKARTNEIHLGRYTFTSPKPCLGCVRLRHKAFGNLDQTMKLSVSFAGALIDESILDKWETAAVG
jgi:hypothetical protein